VDNQTTTFNSLSHPNTEHAARALTLAIRGLRAGERVVTEDGTVIRSIAIRHGAHQQRRFVVLPKGSDSSATHRSVVLGQSAFKTASEAAQKALNIRRDKNVDTDSDQF
jgi:hypothetical protein